MTICQGWQALSYHYHCDITYEEGWNIPKYCSMTCLRLEEKRLVSFFTSKYKSLCEKKELSWKIEGGRWNIFLCQVNLPGQIYFAQHFCWWLHLLMDRLNKSGKVQEASHVSSCRDSQDTRGRDTESINWFIVIIKSFNKQSKLIYWNSL